MGLDRFELRELRNDDGVQTYLARDSATARPVQVHLFAEGSTRQALALLSRVSAMPDAERRRVIDRGIKDGVPYLVTDRLAGFASLREWIDRKSPPTVDEQFAALFEDEFEVTPALTSGAVVPDSPGREAGGSRGKKTASILALILGFLVALLFLILLIAFIAFRPHQL
jgi:hypothetical protein